MGQAFLLGPSTICILKFSQYCLYILYRVFCVYKPIGKEVDSGTTRMKAYFGTREVFDRSFDLCSSLNPVNLSCPFYPGN